MQKLSDLSPGRVFNDLAELRAPQGRGVSGAGGGSVPLSYEFGPNASAFFRLRPNGMLDRRGPAASYLVQRRPNFRSIRSKDDSTTLNLAQLKDGPSGLVNIWKLSVNSVFVGRGKKR